MSNHYFRFKQFTIQQEHCAMKVGTDGVLLGTWSGQLAQVHSMQISRVLDIGTGTGLIALMLAQQLPNAKVDALEIEENAYKQATENSRDSHWTNRINIQHIDFQTFAVQKNYRESYDWIVSNPPYFQNAVQAPQKARTIARHALSHSLTFDELINGVVKLLKKTGYFTVILPTDISDSFKTLANSNNLYCTHILKVQPTIHKAPKRVLLCFTKQKTNVIQEAKIAIEKNKRHEYTEAYQFLTKDFYLKF